MIKNTIKDFAIAGGKPEFDKALQAGQNNIPDWQKIEAAFKGIFKRRYYTNHGPLLKELEEKIQNFLGVKHAICMTSATIGLTIAAKALELKGEVILPAYTAHATAQSLVWAGLKPIFCDIDKKDYNISVSKIEKLINKNTTAILATHLFGNVCDIDGLKDIANKHGIKLYFDAAHAFGIKYKGKFIGNFGEVEIFSFSQSKIINASEGGCVCTNNDDIAARLRNIRSSYGAGKPVDIPFTGNGRMSEAQAAMALLSLAEFEQNKQRNLDSHKLYKKLLSDISGLKILHIDNSQDNSFQYVVCEIDEVEFGVSRDHLSKILQAENVFSKVYLSKPLSEHPIYSNSVQAEFPVAKKLCDQALQLPSGAKPTKENITKICDIIKFVHKNSSGLKI